MGRLYWIDLKGFRNIMMTLVMVWHTLAQVIDINLKSATYRV